MGKAIFAIYMLWQIILNPSFSGVVLNNRRYAGTGEKYLTKGSFLRRKRIDKRTEHMYTDKHIQTHQDSLVLFRLTPDIEYQQVLLWDTD